MPRLRFSLTFVQSETSTPMLVLAKRYITGTLEQAADKQPDIRPEPGPALMS
jgi:hypothetical protein